MLLPLLLLLLLLLRFATVACRSIDSFLPATI
jgi:hypothetical protein